MLIIMLKDVLLEVWKKTTRIYWPTMHRTVEVDNVAHKLDLFP